MKSKLIPGVLFLILVFSSTIFAQFELKPAVGLNFTAFSNDPTNITTSAQLGWQIGGTVSVGEEWYGEGGIFWVHKSNEITEETQNIKFDTELSGVRIPLMVGYHLLGKEAGMAGLRAFGGASLFFLSDVTVENFSSDDFESAAYGVFLGLGVDLAMFFVDVKYEWSLSDVTSVTEFDLGQSRSLFINGGIRIGL
jgi:hypothetical protein